MGNGTDKHHLRFHLPFTKAFSAFGDDWYGAKAEAFSRFFGTPLFLFLQTSIVIAWVAFHITGTAEFDPYPFILMNLVFSLEAAYAAPLILLAQTRQAARDNAHAEADAMHLEALALAQEQRQLLANRHMEQLLELLEQNNQQTQLIKELSERIESLVKDMHDMNARGAR